MADTLLVVEDEALLGGELARHYRREGWEVIVAEDIDAARHVLFDQALDPLVVLSDMNLPDGNALDLLESLRSRGHKCGEWILLTGYGSVPDSVRAVRLGAFDFLEKPCDQERLDMVIAGARRSARAQRRLRDEAAALTRLHSPESFIGRSATAAQVRTMLGKLIRVPFSALIISGETGTGKGLAARILHHSGPRGDAPLIELNCAALPHDLLESELFGHEAGAFTGAKARRRGLLEQAHGGTLFLDEIGEMDLELQTKLLKAIEDRSIRRLGAERNIDVDVQIIAASNRDLEASVREGTFRSDLFHRLSVFRLHLPPLRDRKEDLEDLVPRFVAEYNLKSGQHVTEIEPDAWNRLKQHDWPGNVRELRNIVERCVLFADTETFPVQWLQFSATSASTTSVQTATGTHNGQAVVIPLDGAMTLDDMDRYIIETALEQHDYNVTATARALGTTRETLRYRISKYGLKQAD